MDTRDHEETEATKTNDVPGTEMPETTPSDDLQTLLVYLKTLADQTRLRILGLLAAERRSVEELAALLDLKPSTVSWHLARLKEIGLVEMRAQGNTHIYRMNSKGLGRINRLLAAPERVVMIGDVEADAWERKVLRDFLEEGRLKEIPAYRKKRQIILRWLVTQFELGRVYSEKEVNEVIQRHHPDTATLRRELIGEKLMAREHGMYWRVDPGEPTEPGEVEPSTSL
jgi:predicted transcriptional regulator